ncbi:hypothetical protein QJV45_14270 [Listeria booriae]|uniref:hypothetical protein n=1 Tax=Listeria booriae TaxID=1552123 RepID=UPI0028808023|nr:hypothetical protein [Listeria booriae]MDT0111645.1 hypothetical protein [Listeria booriae]
MAMKRFKLYADGTNLKTNNKVEKMYIGSFEIDDENNISTDDPQSFTAVLGESIEKTKDDYGIIKGTSIRPCEIFWTPVVNGGSMLLGNNVFKRIKDFEWEAQTFDVN